MHVYVIGMGTRGDIQPYIALGLGLQKAGHRVTLCTSENFRASVAERGLTCTCIYDDILENMRSDAGRAVLDDSTSAWQKLAAYRELFKRSGPQQTRMLEEGWRAAEEARPDLILYHPKVYSAPHFAEKLGIPAMIAALVPGTVPTRAFPAGIFPPWRLGGWYNRWTARLMAKLVAMGFGKYVEAWRHANGLPALRRGFDLTRTSDGRPIPVMHGFSRHVVPSPTDWPAHARMTGYWFLDRPATWQPPASLVSFLDAGDPPVYVGFGSMAGSKVAHVSRVIVDALQKAKVRGILATGWGGLTASDLPDTIHMVDDVPHDWLFSRVAAVVHHGGAGTTAAGLRAGRPTLVCPFIVDQPFWGRRVHDLGAGPAPIPRKALRTDNVAQTLRALVDNEAFRRNAGAIGENLRQEDSMTHTLAFIEAQVAALRA
jgi:sterol 3beta-glucosyltransferase